MNSLQMVDPDRLQSRCLGFRLLKVFQEIQPRSAAASAFAGVKAEIQQHFDHRRHRSGILAPYNAITPRN
jgi:hypothetical protein